MLNLETPEEMVCEIELHVHWSGKLLDVTREAWYMPGENEGGLQYLQATYLVSQFQTG